MRRISCVWCHLKFEKIKKKNRKNKSYKKQFQNFTRSSFLGARHKKNFPFDVNSNVTPKLKIVISFCFKKVALKACLVLNECTLFIALFIYNVPFKLHQNHEIC